MSSACVTKVPVSTITQRRNSSMAYRGNKYVKATIAPPPPEVLPDKITIPDGLPPLDDPFWQPNPDRPKEIPYTPKEAPPAEEPQPGQPGGPGEPGGPKKPVKTNT